MISKIKYYIRRLKQYHYYGKAGLNTYDYHFCEYRLLAAHLRRVCDFMHSDKTYTLWTDDPNNKAMRKLREATHIAEILAEDYEPMPFLGRHLDKYPRKAIPWRDTNMFTRVYTNISVELGDFFAKKAMEKDREYQKQLKDRLRSLIDKHGRGWWD
jgi:hypothetical protein